MSFLKGEKMHHQMRSIRSELHQISSYHFNKVSISPFDDKRYILNDGTTSFAYGIKKKLKNNRKLYEVAIRMIKTDDSGIDLKRFNNILSINGKKRSVERRDKKVEKKKPSKEASKTVAMRLQKKLIERGKTPNLNANFFAYTNV